MSKRDEAPEDVEDDLGVDDSVHVHLAQVLDRGDAPLVVLEDVLLFKTGQPHSLD